MHKHCIHKKQCINQLFVHIARTIFYLLIEILHKPVESSGTRKVRAPSQRQHGSEEVTKLLTFSLKIHPLKLEKKREKGNIEETTMEKKINRFCFRKNKIAFGAYAYSLRKV